MLTEFKIKTITGEDLDWTKYQNKVLLFVNVASRCGLTPQYVFLESLYKKYKDQGLEIVGFPCNQFGGQEPGTHEEILNFCETKFKISFILTEKIDVKGPAQHPLYNWLVKSNPVINEEDACLPWNFTKFLIDKNGNVVDRIGPKDPMSVVEQKIVALLSN